MLDSTYTSTTTVIDTVQLIRQPSRLDPFGGQFSNVERIGGGCLSDVYRCFDNERSQQVVLKCLNPITGRRHEDRERFLREPLLMELMDHPSIPRVFGRYRELQPAPFFTMEHLPGVDLSQVLCQLNRQEPSTSAEFPLTRLVELIADACLGFKVAHDQGILHRDIKPENLMISDCGQIHIIDWGVAKPMREPATTVSTEHRLPESERRRNPRLTRAGQQPGTLLYMSPEQAVGLMELDPRSDIYSLGAVLFDCLALKTFICGDSNAEIVDRITSGPQTKPSDVTTRDSIPEALEAVCMRALAIDRRDRFDTMQSFRESILASI